MNPPAPTAPTASATGPIHDWHRRLQYDRGQRAGLRRAQTIDEVYQVLAFHQLLAHAGPKLPHETAARMAIALAEVDADTSTAPDRWGAALGRAFATHRHGKPRLSEDRLRLLATAEDPDQFLRLLRGAIQALDRHAPLQDVADIVRAWHRPASRLQARRQIFLAYYAASTAASGEADDG
ncbi:MAG: type I-E CRISPR-associated protein Cse2/CasB [Rhodospirillaceae bacterium]|nr:type I-E CRISPR-associated protein Cse2/CasB [Rhodospirillaceae bacterium]